MRVRLSLTWLEDRSNPSTLNGTGDTSTPTYDPTLPPAQTSPTPTDPGSTSPTTDPVAPYG